jgi:uncharacterized membrane protein
MDRETGEQPVSRIVVIGFDSDEDARAALQTLRGVEKQGGIKFEDTAIVSMDAEGKVRVKNEASAATEVGAVVGGIIGGLAVVVFPVAGIAIGAAMGAGIGAATGKGVPGEFVKEIKEQLTPGTSALFLQIQEANADMSIAALRQYHGRVIQTSLDDEVEEALRQALS